MTYRNRKLLNLAHDIPCMASFPHQCNDHLGSHPAHSNWLQWGRGVGHKAPDWAYAALCGNAHREIDGKLNPTMDKDTRQSEWLRAFIATQDYLWNNDKVRVA